MSASRSARALCEVEQRAPTKQQGQPCVCDKDAYTDCPGHTRKGLYGQRAAKLPSVRTHRTVAERLLRRLRPNDSAKRPQPYTSATIGPHHGVVFLSQ